MFHARVQRALDMLRSELRQQPGVRLQPAEAKLAHLAAIVALAMADFDPDSL